MPVMSPSPEYEEGIMVEFREGPLGADVAEVFAPTAQDGVQGFDYLFLTPCLARSEDDLSNPVLYALERLLGRSYQQFPVVLPEVESQEVEAVVDVGDKGLLHRQLQTPFREERDQELSDLFRDILRGCGHDEVVGVSHHVDLGVLTEVLFQQRLHPVQGHVRQSRGYGTALRYPLLRREQRPVEDVACLEELPEYPLVHRYVLH